MSSLTLHYENARFAQQLFNHEPRNLQSLEAELGVKATAREGWIKLEGPAAAVERAKQLFASLESLLKSGSPVKNREFTHAPPHTLTAFNRVALSYRAGPGSFSRQGARHWHGRCHWR